MSDQAGLVVDLKVEFIPLQPEQVKSWCINLLLLYRFIAIECDAFELVKNLDFIHMEALHG